jgi:hypothetical protein
MIRPHTPRFWLLLYVIAAALVLSGCSGGGSDTPTQPAGGGAPVVSGTAAAGAPLVGFVGARDINGNEATAQIGQGGGFNLDLTDLDTPVLLFASGISGGNAYQLLSVVLDDDINGTVNITPLTDLIVGNALGEDPVTAFNESGGDENQRAALFAAISAQGIEDQTNLLAARLKPLLDALGVSENFDLRKTPFTADRTGFDAVLDVIEVEVNVTNSSATIRNRLEPGSQINNTFDGTNDETETLVVNEATVTNGVTTIQAVDATLNAVVTAISSGAEGDLTPLLADNFLYSGTSGADFFAAATTGESSGKLIEGLESWSLVEIDDSATPTVVRINIGEPTGNWELQQTEDGFVVAGNQVPFLADADIIHRLNSTSTTPAVDSVSLTFRASNPAATLPAGDPVVSGPGVKSLQLQSTAELNVFEASTTLTGTDIALLESGSEYTVSWDGTPETVASFRVRRGSPEFSSGAPAIAGFDADYISGEFEFSWTLPVGYESRDVRNDFNEDLSEILIESNTRSVSGTLPRTFSPSAGDTAALIAADNFGVLVEVTLENAFANVAPASAPDTLVGSYIIRNTARADNAPYIHFSFFESGNYVHLELGDDFRPVADPSGNTGMEVGTYSWDNVTGAFEFTGLELDQNGAWGASNIPNTDLPIKAITTSTGLTLDFASGGIEQFERVPANSETGGITGTWAIQTDGVPQLEAVVTLLDDGYYFIGDTFPASDGEVPGIEFGTWSWDSESTVFDYDAIYDQNGTAGFADNGFNDGTTLFATVIDGHFISAEVDAFQLNELFAGNPIGDGTLTVDYTVPGSGGSGSPSTPQISDNFHYLLNRGAIEGGRIAEPPYIRMTTENHANAKLANATDGTSTLSWTEICFGNLVAGAKTDPLSGNALIESANECPGNGGGQIDGLTAVPAGLTAALPVETVALAENTIRRAPATLDMFAVDAQRSLFIGQSTRAFGFINPVRRFTDGFEVNTHVLSEKTIGRTTSELAGTWGFIVRRLLTDDAVPNELEYSVGSLVVDVDTTGNTTRTSELDRNVFQSLVAGNSSATFEKPGEVLGAQPIGSISVADDGVLDFIDGEFGGVLSTDANVLFMALMNPIDPLADPTIVPEVEWITGVRLSGTPTRADLDGNEYALISQNYWVESGAFEVDYREPGATLTFPQGGGPASLTWAISFVTVDFVDNPATARDGDPLETTDLQYSADASGRITLNTDFGEPGIVELELNGFATPDNRLLVFENTLIDQGNDGTGPKGGLGIVYAICTNCD